MSRYRNLNSWKPGKRSRMSRVKWEDAYMTVTVGERRIDGKTVKTFELLDLMRESRSDNYWHDRQAKSTGFLIRLIDAIEWHVYSEGIADCIWVDTVVNEFLPKWLIRHGYTQRFGHWPHCFYKMI